jgi:hypothetical protein
MPIVYQYLGKRGCSAYMLQYMLDMLHVVLRVFRDVSEIVQSNLKLEDLLLRSIRLPYYRYLFCC